MKKDSVIIAAAIISIGILFSGGFYTTAEINAGAVYRVNKFTGSVVLCIAKTCEPANWEPNRD